MKHIEPLPPISERVARRRAELQDDARARLLDEVMRLQREVHNCAHCEALRGQIGRLIGLAPPAPVDMNGARYTYTGPWPGPDEIEKVIELGRVQFPPVDMTREEAARRYPDRCQHCWKPKINCEC